MNGSVRLSICSLQEDDYKSMSEQNAVHLASPDTYIKCAIQMSVRHTFEVGGGYTGFTLSVRLSVDDMVSGA